MFESMLKVSVSPSSWTNFSSIWNQDIYIYSMEKKGNAVFVIFQDTFVFIIVKIEYFSSIKLLLLIPKIKKNKTKKNNATTVHG